MCVLIVDEWHDIHDSECNCFVHLQDFAQSPHHGQNPLSEI